MIYVTNLTFIVKKLLTIVKTYDIIIITERVLLKDYNKLHIKLGGF